MKIINWRNVDFSSDTNQYNRAPSRALILLYTYDCRSLLTRRYWNTLFQDGRKMGYGSMQGIPMVASSPVRHDSPLGMNQIDVQSFQPPWKALSEFALHSDLDRVDTSQPHFQQLVNQVYIIIIYCLYPVDKSFSRHM